MTADRLTVTGKGGKTRIVPMARHRPRVARTCGPARRAGPLFGGRRGP